MRYRLFVRIDIEARDDREAIEHGKKLEETLKNPLVKMSLESDGIRPIGQAVVHQPQRV